MVVFYDIFVGLCKEAGKAPTVVLAELGMSKGNLGKWRDGRTPKADGLVKIADYFGVTTDFLTGKGQKEKPADEGGLVNSDIDLTEYLERLAKRPELRMLFSVTKDATKADVEKAVRIIEALRNEEQKK